MIELRVVNVEILATYGTGVAIEFEVVVEDTAKGKYYNLKIPKLLDLREDLEWYYPEIFKAKGSPEMPSKWER